ncbi:unnamed protein product [Coffea canephora]|uniref:Uncharacterized protein n=1 Tax=Coffea canephora TaxID=49390 RepID=A0A068UTB7_COFCA|nr:unnamed protein product [Coffea canephora]
MLFCSTLISIFEQMGQSENGKAPWQGVRERCKSEWAQFQDRLTNADKKYIEQLGRTSILNNRKFCILLSFLAFGSDWKRNIETLEKNSVTSLRTLINLGSEVYMQADVIHLKCLSRYERIHFSFV